MTGKTRSVEWAGAVATGAATAPATSPNDSGIPAASEQSVQTLRYTQWIMLSGQFFDIDAGVAG